VTCIAGLAVDGEVTIGGDSAGVGGYSLQLRADSKVFRTQNYVMGFTTSFRMGQILRYAALPEAPAERDAWDLDRWMATTFVDAVRQVLGEGGWLSKSNEREAGGTFLVGVRGLLYEIESDFQVGRTLCGYAAVGCGQDLALGSLHTTSELEDWQPAERMQAALEAAAAHSAGVAPPFVIARTPAGTQAAS
jgi:hypothetical protein